MSRRRTTIPVLVAGASLVLAGTAAAQATQPETPVVEGHGYPVNEGTVIHHEVFREHDAGSVELWEIEADERSDPVDAFEPWADETAGARSVDRLCQRIAATIKGWIDKEELPAQGRKVRAGDILILVRRRDPFTTPMIRELKRLNVPVAGADRMKLMDQLAVHQRDLPGGAAEAEEPDPRGNPRQFGKTGGMNCGARHTS